MLATVYGCAGFDLTGDERAFFRDTDPYGFILFKRNCQEPDQVKRLIADLRDSVGREVPVMIDQEGGRVLRLSPPHWRKAPPARPFGTVYQTAPELAVEGVRLNSRLLAAELNDLGITVNCLPVVDLAVEGVTEAIGNRSYGSDAEMVSRLGRAAADGLLEGGVLPVMKHMPGHGRAIVDSHLELPHVDTDPGTLSATDFAAFKALSDLPMGMTGHILFTEIDSRNAATISRKIIDDVIRREIGFDGLLFTDDLSMKALSGTVGQKARAGLDAGCDIALHCNGDMEEMIDVANSISGLTDDAIRRAKVAEDLRRSHLSKISAFNIDDAIRRVDEIVARGAEV